MTDATRRLGQRGERLAEDALRRAGARVLARNYRCPAGEIDLVVEHDGDLVAVEVKTRRGDQPVLPEEAVGFAKRTRLGRALEYFAQEQGREDASLRVDVVAIQLDASDRVQRLDHISNVVE